MLTAWLDGPGWRTRLADPAGGPGWRTRLADPAGGLAGGPGWAVPSAAQREADAEGAEPGTFGRTTPEWAHGRVNPTTWLSPPADDALP